MRAEPQGSMQKGTRRRALLVFLLIAATVAIAAVNWPSHRSRTQIELYLRQGPQQGAALLKRDIDQLSPARQDPGPAVQHLGALGLSCAAPATGTGEWTCLMRRPGDGRKMIAIEATIRVQDGLVAATSTRIEETLR